MPRLIDMLAWARNWRARALFQALERYCRGQVLDVGGGDFFLSVSSRLQFDTWVNLEDAVAERRVVNDSRYRLIHGSGCAMDFSDASFDTVVNVQVLEHVLEPLALVREIGRVLKPGGYAILLVPQTSMLHMAPRHYYNFTRFWVREAISAGGMEIVELRPLGGFWSSRAATLFYFTLQVVRVPGMSTAEDRRGAAFYLLVPFMLLYAAISLPVMMLFSLGDLTEEPNNHLVVARKK